MTEETLFHAALAKPASERAVFLEGACLGNPELLAAVQGLLAAHEASLNPLDQPLPVDATQQYTPSPSGQTQSYRSSDPTPGFVIGGRYTLEQKIGEGGMGEVWVAKQSEPVKRKVAIKLIKAGMDSKSVVQRFEQERQALALMDHPNIAKVLDGGLTEHRQPFFVMELVNGLPLTKFCDETRLNIHERLGLFIPICQAVQHAHQKGIVHRDLKPANILVTMIDGKPVPKVIDFGVAKATGGKLTDESMSTQFGAVVGTLEYMSPEQAGYSNQDVDTRADIYSLGVILYELLTGLRPFDSKRLKKAALDEMIRMIREEEPSKPSTRLSTDESLPSLAASRHIEPSKLTALLRGELDWVVMKCLEKQRDRRYETANGLARDIQRYLADEVIEARAPSTGYRLKKFVRRHKGQMLAASLVFLALLAGVVGTGIGMAQARQANRELSDKNKALEAERLKVEQRFEMARKSIGTFHTVITNEKELEKEAFRSLRKKLLTEAAGFYRELEMLLAGETDVKSRTALANGLAQLGSLTESIGDQAQALAVNQRTLAVRRELAEAKPLDAGARLEVARCLLTVGRSLFTTGDPAGGLRAFEEGQEILTALQAETPTDAIRLEAARCLHQIGRVQSVTGRLKEALANHEKGLALRRGLADANPSDTEIQSDLASSHANLGYLLTVTGKLMGALDHYEKARDIHQKLADANPADSKNQDALAGLHSDIGYVLAMTDKPTSALASYGKALDIHQKLANANPAVTEIQFNLALVHTNIGDLHWATGHTAEAFASWKSSRDLHQKLADANPAVTKFQSFLASSHNSIGVLLTETGKPAEALISHGKALDIRRKLYDASPTVQDLQRDLSQSLLNIGIAQSMMGRPHDALSSYVQARNIRQKLVDASPTVFRYQSGLAQCHLNIGIVLMGLGKRADSMASWTKARNLYQKLADGNSTLNQVQRELALCHSNIGRLHAHDGRFADAFASFDAGLTIFEKLVSSDPVKAVRFTNDLGEALVCRGWARVLAGQPYAAASDLRKGIELLSRESTSLVSSQFEKARALALLAKLVADPKSGVTVQEAKAFADRSITILADAIKAGWNQLDDLKGSDFDALRDRADFQKLVAKLNEKSQEPTEKK